MTRWHVPPWRKPGDPQGPVPVVDEQLQADNADPSRCCDDCGADLVAGQDHRDGCALADDDHAGECGELDAAGLGLPPDRVYWCHADAGHPGGHVLGH